MKVLAQAYLRNLIVTFLALSPTLTLAGNPGKIQLTRVKQLVLRKDAKTTGRRNAPIPQLKCVGGDAKGLYEVDVMKCQNMGSDYEDSGDVSWECTASLPKWFKLGSTDVLCEGYNNPDDPYILKGSCGVEYTLLLTEAGHEKYGSRNKWKSSTSKQDTPMDWSDYLFFLLFFGVLAFIVYAGCTGTTPPEGRRPGGNRPGFGGGGGGGGGGGWGGGDPPPPYDYKPSAPPQQQQQGWRPGFWSGMAAGAAARHLMGDGNRRTRQPPYENIYHRGQPGDGGLYGYGGGPSRRYDDGDPGSSSRHTSTGYGQTRRR